MTDISIPDQIGALQSSVDTVSATLDTLPNAMQALHAKLDAITKAISEIQIPQQKPPDLSAITDSIASLNKILTPAKISDVSASIETAGV